MFRIDGPGATPDNKFSEGDPANGTRATVVTDEWLNAVQEEVAKAIEDSGQVLKKADSGQLSRVLKSRVINVGSVAELEALSLDGGQQTHLAAGSRTGSFRFNASDLSAEVASDPLQGIYIAPSSDPTGASGASVRQYGQAVTYSPQINVGWWGAAGADESYETEFDAIVDWVNTHGSTGSSGKELNGFSILIPDGVYDLSLGLASSVDVDNVTWKGQSQDATILKVRAGECFKFGEGLDAGRAHGGGITDVKFYATDALASQICISLYKTAHLNFERIRLRDVGRFAKLGDFAAGDITTSASFVGITGWVRNLGVPTFDLQEGAGFVFSESYIFTNIPVPEQFTGTHDGADDSAALSDSTASFSAGALVGGTVYNKTDGSSGVITDNTATTVVATLSGGSENDWDAADAYTVQAPHEALAGQNFINCEGNWDTVQLSVVRCNRYYHPLNVDPATSANANNWFFENFYGDFNARGYRFNSDGANIRNHRYTDVWSFCMDGDAIALTGGPTGRLDDMRITNPTIGQSGRDGIRVEKVDGLTIVAGKSQGNGRLTAGQGLNLVDGDNITIQAGDYGLSSEPVSPYDSQAQYGVKTSVDVKRYSLQNIRAAGVLGGYDIANPSAQPGSCFVRFNRKTDGGAPEYRSFGSITVPASPATFINDTPFEKSLYINGGTVSQINKNGVRVGAGTNMQIAISPGDTVQVTYSAIPVVVEEVLP